MKSNKTFLIILLIICLYLFKAELIGLIYSSIIAFCQSLAIFRVFLEETFNFLLIEILNGIHNYLFFKNLQYSIILKKLLLIIKRYKLQFLPSQRKNYINYK
jgi:hypothetical protein